MSLIRINFLHLTVSEIQPGQTFSRRKPAHPDTMGENNTPTALKGCGVKMAKALDDQYALGLRLASFLGKWPKDEIVSSVDLVKAGLFYCGPGDRVKFAFCGGIMYNWVTGDIPLKEHLKPFQVFVGLLK